MEWKEALPLLQGNHTGVAVSVTPKDRSMIASRPVGTMFQVVGTAATQV